MHIYKLIINTDSEFCESSGSYRELNVCNMVIHCEIKPTDLIDNH